MFTFVHITSVNWVETVTGHRARAVEFPAHLFEGEVPLCGIRGRIESYFARGVTGLAASLFTSNTATSSEYCVFHSGNCERTVASVDLRCSRHA
jgi:hypothetical protein